MRVRDTEKSSSLFFYRAFSNGSLGQNVTNDVSVDIGEPEVAALVAVGESLVVDAH